MSQISEVNEHILTKILKIDEFYEALWGKEDFTPEAIITEPNDYNCGALANPLEYVYEFIKDITGTDLSLLPEPYIDIIVYFITGLKRFTDESTAELLIRMESLLIREADWRSERFGTPWDIKNVFSYYLDRDTLYYVPNAVLTDLIINGDFEIVLGAEWVLDPSTIDRSIGDSFTGDYKLDFTGLIEASQSVSITSGSYILNSFVNPLWTGNTFYLVVQRDSDNYYYNTTIEEWQAGIANNTFTALETGWQIAEFFIIVDGSYDIDIKFVRIADFYLDHVEFGEKLYPSFELLYTDAGIATGFASAWDTDPTYENASYLDQDFMFSSATSAYTDTYYQALLDVVKAAGVEATWLREERSTIELQELVLGTTDAKKFVTTDGKEIRIISL